MEKTTMLSPETQIPWAQGDLYQSPVSVFNPESTSTQRVASDSHAQAVYMNHKFVPSAGPPVYP
jgi:hypothetical protein